MANTQICQQVLSTSPLVTCTFTLGLGTHCTLSRVRRLAAESESKVQGRRSRFDPSVLGHNRSPELRMSRCSWGSFEVREAVCP